MPPKIGVLVLRGSGDTGFDRQERFSRRLNRHLERSGCNPDELCFAYADWYAPLQEQQDIIIERMLHHPELKLRARAVRKLLIGNIADLITYGGRPNTRSDAYERMHSLVHEAILKLSSQLPENAPLVIIASSMGTEIINNYIWDRQQGYDKDKIGKTAFDRLETLTGLFTMGNNIPIFAASFNVEELQPISFPSPDILSGYASLTRWENFYDRHDPLGYPVKFLNDHYAKTNVSDIQVGVGNPLTAWNILSHFGYWTSRKMVKRIASYLSWLSDSIE